VRHPTHSGLDCDKRKKKANQGGPWPLWQEGTMREGPGAIHDVAHVDGSLMPSQE